MLTVKTVKYIFENFHMVWVKKGRSWISFAPQRFFQRTCTYRSKTDLNLLQALATVPVQWKQKICELFKIEVSGASSA